MPAPDVLARLADGWAVGLAHSLWIGSLAALLVAALLRRLPAQRADLRAGVAFAGLVVSLVGSIATPLVTQPSWRVPGTSVAPLAANAATHPIAPTTSEVSRAERLPPREAVSPSPTTPPTVPRASWRRAVVGVWLIGVAVSLVRLGRSHVAARRLVRSAAAVENRSLEALLDGVARTLRVVTRATLRVSDRAATPLVYGFWSPVILLPASLATGATPETLRVVLAHELWHLRRGDLWQTVVQRLVEAALFYHPAVWWLSRLAEREREAACDAAAARVVGHGAPVATALLDVASLGATTPAAAMSIGGGSLGERVQRLLRPGDQPRVRVAWGGLLALSLLGVAALLSLTAGTGLVAREVVVAMTPAERVAAIEQAIAETAPADQKIDPRTGRLPDDTPLCRVTWRFEMPEGGAKPRRLLGNLVYPGMNGTVGPNDSGVFVENVPQGSTFYLQAHVEGYADEQYGPFKAVGESLDLGGLALTRGFTARLVVVDPDGQPVEGAAVVRATVWARFSGNNGSGTGLSNAMGRESGADGVIELDRLPQTPIELTVQKPGFERLREEVAFTPGGSVTLTLRRSKPTTGRFVDTAGNPVAGVELYCVRSDGDSLGGNDPRRRFLDKLDGGKWSETPLAISNDAGEFTLPWLIGSATYSLLALHKDYQPTRFDELQAGQQLGDIVAKPPLEVSGRVLNVSSLGEGRTQPRLYYSNPITYPRMSYTDNASAPLDDEGRFSLRQIIPGAVIFNIAGQSIRRDLTHSIHDIEIDGDKIRNWQAENYRAVRVRIEAPDNQPVRGTVQLSWTTSDTPLQDSQRGYENLDIPTEGDPVVETQAPVGAQLWFNDYNMIGAYSKERRLGAVPPGEGPYETSVAVEPAGLVVGQVADARGAPLPDSTVRLRVVEGPSDFSVRDADKLSSEGKFSLGPLPLDGDRRFVCEAQVNNTWRFVTSEPFTVTAAKPIHEVKLQAPDPIYLTGQVLDHHGQPAAKWPTSLERSLGSNTFRSGLGPLDDEGRFRIAITPGPTEAKYTLKIRLANGSAGLSLRYTPGWLSRGKDFGVVRLGPGGIVRGVVTTADGKPVSTSVLLMPVDYENAAYSDYLTAKTNERGEFQIEGAERVPQRFSVIGPNLEVFGVEPASAWVEKRYSNGIRVEPTDAPVELRITVRKSE